MEHHTDQKIIDGIRNREDAAFKYLQVTFQDTIRLMVREMGGTPEDSRDVFSEGLIALIKLIDQPGFSLTCKLSTLVYALCRKKWEQQLEQRKAVRNYHLRKLNPDPDPDFTEESDQRLLEEIFWECFRELDQSCRDILERYLREISPKDIADELGLSYGYVRKRKSLCHSFLMKMIETHPDVIRIRKEEKIESYEIQGSI